MQKQKLHSLTINTRQNLLFLRIIMQNTNVVHKHLQEGRLKNSKFKSEAINFSFIIIINLVEETNCLTYSKLRDIVIPNPRERAHKHRCKEEQR